MAKVKLFKGSVHPELSQQISNFLDLPLGKLSVSRFRDGELKIESAEEVKGSKVVIIQPTSPPVNERLMELLLLIDTFKKSASEIIAVIPYFGYARQNERKKTNEPLSAELVARLISEAGADTIISVDLHEERITDFIDISFKNVNPDQQLAECLDGDIEEDDETVVIAPDFGAESKAKNISQRLELPFGVLKKERKKDSDWVDSELHYISKDSSFRRAVIVDDMISSGGTVLETIKVLKSYGVEEFEVAVTHGIFSEGSLEKLQKSPLKKIIVSDSIPLEKNPSILDRFSVAPLLAKEVEKVAN